MKNYWLQRQSTNNPNEEFTVGTAIPFAPDSIVYCKSNGQGQGTSHSYITFWMTEGDSCGRTAEKPVDDL